MKLLTTNYCEQHIPFDSPMVAGGVQKFSKSIYESFEDTSVFNPLFVDDQRKRNEQNRDFINTIHNTKPDLVLINNEQGLFTNKEIINQGYPIMMVCHILVPMRSFMGRLINLKAMGHSIYGVSKFQEDSFDNFAKRTGETEWSGFDGIIRPGYVSDWVKADTDTEYDLTTIGRFDSSKNPFLLKQLTDGTDLSSSLYSSKINLDLSNNNLSHSSYHKRVSKYIDDSCYFGLPHHEILDGIQKANVFYSTWNSETFGITALEAFSRGLPVICNSKNNSHASECIPQNKDHIILIEKDKDQLVEAYQKLKNVDKQSLIDQTYEKHNKDKWISHLSVAFEKSIDKFNSVNTVTLESFMV